MIYQHDVYAFIFISFYSLIKFYITSFSFDFLLNDECKYIYLQSSLQNLQDNIKDFQAI